MEVMSPPAAEAVPDNSAENTKNVMLMMIDFILAYFIFKPPPH
jgi:hypothetical protein